MACLRTALIPRTTDGGQLTVSALLMPSVRR
jgi:hypothetical protein